MATYLRHGSTSKHPKSSRLRMFSFWHRAFGALCFFLALCCGADFVHRPPGPLHDWQFASLRPTLRHVGAIAIHRPGQPDFPGKLRELEMESFLLANSEIG